MEKKAVEKIDSYIELEQYLGSIILPIRKSIRNNIYWKSKHVPRMLGEAMKKAEELYMKHKSGKRIMFRTHHQMRKLPLMK